MTENPRVAKLVEQLKTLKAQQKLLETQVAAVLVKLPIRADLGPLSAT